VSLAGVPATRSTNFVNWLHRYLYESEGLVDDSTGILGDMIHSGITVVGRPRHKTLSEDATIRNRDAVVYAQTNRGVLHAFNYMTGHEIWGFIPPSIFQYRLKNLKFDSLGGWIDGNALTRIRSNPMVLLDGMLIARDVVHQNSVNTLLLGYLGHGGNGFYAMNISRMDSSTKDPVFEWAIENARYDNTGSAGMSAVKRWGKAADGGVGDGYDYRDLGLTIVPGVCFTPANVDNTIGVLPGGLGHRLGLGGDTQGKAFYFFNPTNGSIIKRIDSSSNTATGFEALPSTVLGMGISPIIYQENNSGKATTFYTADSEGNILRCDTTDSVSNWKLKNIFQLRTLGRTIAYEGSIATPPAENLPISIPRKMILARARNGHSWLFGGTSDLYAPGSDSSDARKIINGEQFIFGLNTNNIQNAGATERNQGMRPYVSVFNKRMRNLPYYAEGIPAEYRIYGRAYSYDDRIGVEYGKEDYGWLLRLRPKINAFTEAEYLSADPYLMNGVLYMATFIPLYAPTTDKVCANIGIGKLYALDPSTGLSVMPDRASVFLENVKIAGISGIPSEGRLLLSVKELRTEANRIIFDKFNNASEIGNALFMVDALGGKPVDPDSGPAEFDMEELVPIIEYWREKF
jgi:Tfp pilus tip-associated adhesin PilY1